MISRAEAEALDLADPLRAKRQLFVLPEKTIYLDGNSLGPLPRHVAARLAGAVSDEWGQSLIRGWNMHGWFDLPRRLGDRIGKLIGAEPGTVLAADSTSINLVKVLTAALRLRPDRRVILSDSGNFPSDLYVAQGVIQALGGGFELRVAAPEDVEESIGDDLAVLMLTEVDYRTGRRHDMKRLIAKAQAKGALTIWDLCHSAGAFPVDLTGAHGDFAVGCGYKYLNGGPGAPAFVYVRRDLQDKVVPSLSGWMGHAAPFAFDLDYRPAHGIDRLRAGTPGVLSMIALDCALDVWEGVDMRMLRDKSERLAELFIAEVEERCAGYGLKLASPRDAGERGSQVSFHCADGYAVMQALIAEGVIGDFRAPDIIRFGLTPL
ncbi:MAG TPA: kynureninase, partial [Nordella sp.]|nr:kynureninase [Nordella sp.]